MLKEQIAEVLDELVNHTINCLGGTDSFKAVDGYADQIIALFEQSKQAALKEQMERVISRINKRIEEQERVFDLAIRTKTNAKLQVLKALKAELLEEVLDA